MISTKMERGAKGKTLALGFLLAALMAAGVLLPAGPAHATTYTVNSTDDGGDQSLGNGICDTEPFQVGTEPKCTLRAAIQDANAAAGADTITVPAGTYTLTMDSDSGTLEFHGDLDIRDDLTINGAGARTTSVVAGPELSNERIFENWSGVTTTINGLTITGGETSFPGGGVSNQGNLTLDEAAVKDNTASIAGGIDSSGTLNITDSIVSGNSATIPLTPTSGLTNMGGGVVQGGGTANITNSTISGNRSADYGGGVAALDGAIMNILNSTIAFNTSGRLGGGILTEGTATLVTVKNSIVAGNTLDNCDTAQLSGGIISSQGNNISNDASCGFTTSTDKQGTDPLLGPLADNGGPTDTHALLAGSPAIDAGTNTGCPAADQRGVARPQRTACDIGAFERRNSPPLARDDAYNAREDTTLTKSVPGVLANDTDAEGDTLRAALVSRPTKGTLTLNANGSFAYRPRANLSGTDTFTYRTSDGHGGTDTATVQIRIAPVNDAPTITPISPAPGASTSDRTPLIRARVKDAETNLAEANIRLLVDGLGVAASRFVYDRDTDVLSHTPTTALGLGSHTVKVVTTDAQGRSATRQWGFKVV